MIFSQPGLTDMMYFMHSLILPSAATDSLWKESVLHLSITSAQHDLMTDCRLPVPGILPAHSWKHEFYRSDAGEDAAIPTHFVFGLHTCIV